MKKVIATIVSLMIILTSFGTITFAAEANGNVYDGHYSLKITSRGTDAFKFFTCNVKVEKNTDYVAKCYSKGGGDNSLRIMNSYWSSTLLDKKPKGGTIWQENTFEFNSGDNNSIVFALTNNPYGGGGTMYIDNVSVTPKADPSNELVTNGGFEADANWKFGADGMDMFTKEYSEEEVVGGTQLIEYEENIIDQPNGNNGLKLYAGHKSLAFMATDTASKVYQNVTVKENTDYKVSFWIRSPESLKVKFDINSSSDNIYTNTVNATASWTRKEFVFNSGTNTALTYEFNSISGQTGELFIDYCMLIPKMKPKGMGIEQLLSDISFEKGGSWIGADNEYGQEGFSLYIRDKGTMGNISGGIRIMPVGDSITAGVGSTSAMPGGYKKALYDMYIAEGLNVNFVGPNTLGEGNGFPAGSGHAGNSGWRTDQTDSMIEGWVSQYRPQVILYMLGANDALQDDGSNGLAAAAPDRIRSTMAKIHAVDPSVKVFLASATPLGNGGKNTLIKNINAEIINIANDNPDFITYVDQFTAFPSGGISNDYVHPNDTGYQGITQKWFDDTKDFIGTLSPADISIDDSTAYDGKHSLKYNPYHVPYYTVLSWEMYAKSVNVEPNTDYTLTMMVKGDQGVSLQVRLQTSWGGGVFASPTTSCGPVWTEFKYKFTTADITSVIIAMFNNCMSTGSMYVDCFQITKDSTGETLISNPSFEPSEDASVPFWGNPGFPWSIAEDTSENESSDAITIMKNGMPVTSLSVGTIDISADLTGIADDGARLVAALYEGNQLKYVDISGKAVTSSVSVNVTSVTADTKLKVFLLSDDETLEPVLAKPITK